jgi:hypothetical protein
MLSEWLPEKAEHFSGMVVLGWPTQSMRGRIPAKALQPTHRLAI